MCHPTRRLPYPIGTEGEASSRGEYDEENK